MAIGSLLWPVVVLAGGPHPSHVSAAPRWTTLLAAPVVREPTGIAVDRRGNPRTAKWAYVADAASRRIVKFSTRGRVLGSWTYGEATQRGTAVGLAVGGAGNVFVADPGAGTISKFSPAGRLLARWTGFAQPRALAIEPSGAIDVAETGAHRLTELSPAGAFIARWDTEAGFPQEYTVPHVDSGSLGTPTAVAWQPPDSLYVGTRCVAAVSCAFHSDLPTPPDQVDALLNLRVRGPLRGYLGNWWFGLGHARNDTPQQTPFKEAEPIVTIDSLAADLSGRAYVAGMMWPRGETARRAVIGYGPLGYKWGYWPLPGSGRVRGIGVDGSGGIYVAQGGRVLVLRLSP